VRHIGIVAGILTTKQLPLRAEGLAFQSKVAATPAGRRPDDRCGAVPQHPRRPKGCAAAQALVVKPVRRGLRAISDP
jgi:hypothetical protein